LRKLSNRLAITIESQRDCYRIVSRLDSFREAIKTKPNKLLNKTLQPFGYKSVISSA